MSPESPLAWTPEAEARLRQVPEGVMRELTRQRVEKLARLRGQPTVTMELVQEKYQQWLEGSAQATSEMAWTQEARGRMERVPTFVRGMVVSAVEAYARDRGTREITSELVDEAKRFWAETGHFHQP